MNTATEYNLGRQNKGKFSTVSDTVAPPTGQTSGPVVFILYDRRPGFSTGIAEVIALRDAGEEVDAQVVVLDPHRLDLILGAGTRGEMLMNGEPLVQSDCVINRLGKLTDGHCRAIVRSFELQGIRAVNSADANERCADRLRCQSILAANELPIPKTIACKRTMDIGLMLDARFILQDLSLSRSGIIHRTLIVNGEVLGSVEFSMQNGCVVRVRNAKIEPVENVRTGTKELAKVAAKALEVDTCCSVDILVDEVGRPAYVWDVNPSPAFVPFVEAYPELEVARQILTVALDHTLRQQNVLLKTERNVRAVAPLHA